MRRHQKFGCMCTLCLKKYEIVNALKKHCYTSTKIEEVSNFSNKEANLETCSTLNEAAPLSSEAVFTRNAAASSSEVNRLPNRNCLEIKHPFNILLTWLSSYLTSIRTIFLP